MIINLPSLSDLTFIVPKAKALISRTVYLGQLNMLTVTQQDSFVIIKYKLLLMVNCQNMNIHSYHYCENWSAKWTHSDSNLTDSFSSRSLQSFYKWISIVGHNHTETSLIQRCKSNLAICTKMRSKILINIAQGMD